jgi:hypothetical protein
MLYNIKQLIEFLTKAATNERVESCERADNINDDHVIV